MVLPSHFHDVLDLLGVLNPFRTRFCAGRIYEEKFCMSRQNHHIHQIVVHVSVDLSFDFS